MAIQVGGKKKGAQINRTPAPDEVSEIRNPKGGSGFGQNAPQPSVIPPGQGGPQSLLGKNLKESVDDEVIDQVLARGVAGRGDAIPADGDDLQTRSVSSESYPVSSNQVRQQDPNFFAKKAALPVGLTKGQTDPMRKPS